MLIEGVVHLNARIPTRDRLDLGANAHIQMLLWKPNKVHFQFIEPEVKRAFDINEEKAKKLGKKYISYMSGELRKVLIYHTKKRFEVIDKYVEKYIVFIGDTPITFT